MFPVIGVKSEASGCGRCVCEGGVLMFGSVEVEVPVVTEAEEARKGSFGTGGTDAARSPASKMAAERDDVSNLVEDESEVGGRSSGKLLLLLMGEAPEGAVFSSGMMLDY